MKLAHWPAKDRGLWRAALAPVDPFEKERGNRYGYRPHSNRKVETGYGRWLTELDHHGLLDPASYPADRITRERVIACVRELDCRDNSGNTVLGRLQELAAMACRDSLIIALLALVPLRRGNLLSLAMGTCLIKNADQWMILITSKKSKNHDTLEYTWPEMLVPHLRAYLEAHRPVLTKQVNRWKADTGNHLWVSSHGSPMTEMAIYGAIAIRNTLERLPSQTIWAEATAELEEVLAIAVKMKAEKEAKHGSGEASASNRWANWKARAA